jgi:2-dehydro-3-deoxyphosphooctonate aldolase (KDO 8-P synthase)
VSVTVGNICIAPENTLCVIAGPCQIESEQHALDTAGNISEICSALAVPMIYKSSFDKANRTSVSAQRGAGLETGLSILARVKKEIGVPVLTDIHESYQAEIVAQAGIDVIQIPAFLCRQTDLLLAAGATGCVINVKKGQFLAPGDMARVAEKIASTGNRRILLTERGVTHGYNTLVVDMRSLPIMARTGYPVVFDCTHSVQEPGGLGSSSGGDRSMVPYLARAAAATGSISAVFIETHQDPDRAPSDGPNMIPLHQLSRLIESIKKVHDLVVSL